MRKIILNLAISLDGFIEGPNGEYDWCFTDQDYGLTDFIKRVDTIFTGRKTYEMMEKMGANPTGFPKMKEYVFSTTLASVKEDAVLINKNIKEQVAAIKTEKGKDIWLFGGAGLTESLLNLGLVDEMQLAVHPIILGSGKPLCSGIKERTNLELLYTKSYPTGLIAVHYKIITNK
jgi:dihydrofolate reductase